VLRKAGNEMINKNEEIKFKEIKRVSPSQFFSMKNCAYKSLLAEAFDKKPLLPISPNAYFGTVLHKILELIVKGVLKSEDDFNTAFDKQIKAIEEELQENVFDFFVPLQKKVRNFGLKKVQLRKKLIGKLERQTKLGTVRFHSEKWFESKDKLIGGKVDLVIENDDSIEIIDFKIGAITRDCLYDEGASFSVIKNEYKAQLKIYAYLYFENTGKFPTSLSLVNLAKQKFSIEFTREECKKIYDEAKIFLTTINGSINTKLFSVNPTEENCRYCLYRPACSFFQEKLEMGFSFGDVWGKIKEVRKFHNGNVSVFLQNGENNLIIKNFNSDTYEEFNNHKNKKIYIYNVRKEAIDFVYSASEITMIYESK
jgi:CRISPR/Cas system-associated exonuclease Cas4 (RecB family)